MLFALFAAMTVSVLAQVPVHHDIAWPLWVAERVLGGAELYVDIVEVHPPLIIGVAIIAVLLGRLPVLDPISSYHLVTFTTVACSLVLCWKLLAPMATRTQRHGLMLVIAFLLFPFVGYSFGQEEHLMLALALPYLLMMGGLADGVPLSRGNRLMIGLLGGVGFSMKPFFGPLWLALVLYIVLRRGTRQVLAPEVWAPALVISGYILFTALVTPGYFDVVAMAASVYPHFFPVPPSAIVMSAGTGALAVALLLDRSLPASAAGRGVRHAMLIALVCFYLAVILQGKGWSYHWYPVYAAAALLTVLALVIGGLGANTMRSLGETGSRTLRVLATTLLLALSWWRVSWTREHWGDLSGNPFHLPQLKSVVERYAEGGPIAALSIGMPVAFPLVNYAGVEWSPRFACLWMLPGIYADVRPRAGAFDYTPTSAMSMLDRYVVESLTADLVRDRPALIIVDKAPPMPRLQGFDYLDYLGRHPAFRRLMSEYGHIGNVGRYDIYRRIGL